MFKKEITFVWDGRAQIIKETMIKYFFFLCLIFPVISAKSTEPLRQLMENRLKPYGKNPVHSIQVYISNQDKFFSEAVGYSDGEKLPARNDNQFKIASITKMFTAVVILQLQEEGCLQTSDKLAQYLDHNHPARVEELHFYKGRSYGNQLTIRQLLEHRSGLADLFTDAQFRFYIKEFLHKDYSWSPETLMNQYYRYHLNKKAHFAPDSGYYYSDINFFLLGMVIEKITGQTLAQQFRKRILEPLSMQNTFFEYYEPTPPNTYFAHSFLGKMDVTNKLNTSYDWAGGGLVSTTEDLAKFIRGLFAGQLFKKQQTLNQMIAVKMHTSKSGKTSGYGSGISQYIFNGDIFFGHAGFWGALVAYCPSKKITFCGNINQAKSPFDTHLFIEQLLANF